MITVLRGMLKSHVYRVVLWVFLAVLIFGGISFDFDDNKPWVVKVYKEKSTELEYRQAVTASQRQYDYLKSQGINWPRNESIEKEVLRHIVTKSLMQNVAQDLSMVIPSILLDEKLKDQFASLPDYFFDANGQLIVSMLEKAIAPRSFESLLGEMEDEIKSSLMYSLISLGTYASQFEVATQYTEEYADKKYSILTFSLQKALAQVKEKKVSDEVLQRFYKKNEHGDTYKTAEKRSGQYWKFNFKDYGLVVSKSDVSAYYDKRKQSDYLEELAQVQVHRIFFVNEDDNGDARAQAQIVHDELSQDPATFAAVAKKISAAKLPSQGSSKTEFFAKDSDKHDKILINAAFEQLSQDGDVSEVIKTEKGYEVLQRVARKAAKYKALSEVQAQIEEKLLEEKFAKRFKQDAERLIGNVAYNKEALTIFVDKRKGSKSSLVLDTKKPGLLGMQLFQANQGGYVVFMDGKDGVLLQCSELQKKVLKPFGEIKSTVTSDYYRKQAQQELKTVALDAMKHAETMNFDDIAKKYEAHVETAEVVYKDGQVDQPAILRRPEIMQNVKALQSEGAMIDVVTLNESFLIRLDEISELDEKLFDEKKSAIEAALANKAKSKGRDSFIASLYRHAKLNSKIEIKEQLLKDTKDTSL